MKLLKRILLVLPVLFLTLTCSDDDEPEKFILSVTITPDEGGTVSPDGGTFEDGTEVTLTGTPSEGYIFKEWMGDLKSTENPVSVSMDTDMSITLVFVKSDEDNDGVFDDVDQCLNTPEGEEVNEEGCSSSQIDTDGDGISDDNDLCNDTPEGEEADEQGCADSQKDTDEDGVTDDLDVCPNTPEGEAVNEEGCSASQIDTDGDGVFDNVDICADTPEGEEVDENGCSDSQKDTDGDGITDDVDVCPDTPEGEEVSEEGCSSSQIDSDGDGVFDNVDTCPDTPEGQNVDINGCLTESPIYLDENGVTVKCYDWGEVGNTGIIDGVVYTVVDETLLREMVINGGDVTKVCTSKVTNMRELFFFSDFNEDISSWDVGNVTNMSGMFGGDWWMVIPNPFNQDISFWDVGNVTDMSGMFWLSEFNQPLQNWDVSNVKDMNKMFLRSSFNQSIGNWNVSSVQDMSNMFNSSSINQDLSDWNVDTVTDCRDFSHNTPQWTLPKPNFTNCNPDQF